MTIPAAKKRGRSRLTNDPVRVRAPGRSTHARRLRDLFNGFMANLDPDNVVAAALALRAAELTQAGEDIRVRIKSGELELAGELVRIENLCDRAVRGLGKLPQKPALSYRERLMQQIAEERAAAEDEGATDEI